MASKLSVTYRDLAKMFCRALPLDGQELHAEVENTIEAIRALPAPQRQALKVAYIFASKVPWDEREDLYQELAVRQFEASPGNLPENYAYTVARLDWVHWLRQWYKDRALGMRTTSLSSTVSGEDGDEVEFVELIAGEVEWQQKYDGDLDGETLFGKLPTWVQQIVQDKIQGREMTVIGDNGETYTKRLHANKADCRRLNAWASTHLDEIYQLT